jgi:hypothetical protein
LDGPRQVLRINPNIQSGSQARRVKTDLDLEISRPGSLVVRCFKPVSDTIRYAHTSSFYFLEDGRLPVKKSEAERWAAYVQLSASAQG